MKSFQIIELEEQKKVIQNEIINLSNSSDIDKKLKIDILTNDYNDINEQIKELKKQETKIQEFSPIVIIGMIALFFLIGKKK
jgi:hypothetical protein